MTSIDDEDDERAYLTNRIVGSQGKLDKHPEDIIQELKDKYNKLCSVYLTEGLRNGYKIEELLKEIEDLKRINRSLIEESSKDLR
jgi:hypothetical protein